MIMFKKKTAIITFAFLGILVGMSGIAQAVQLISQDEALKKMFPDTDAVTTETVTLTAADIAKIKSRLGGQLVHFQTGSESAKVEEKTSYSFFIGKKAGKIIRVALIDVQPGKWGPVEFIIALNTDTGKVQNMAVMSYSEKRGRPIARENFLSQFYGKGSADPITLHKDIRAISGATISSDASCFVVKKAIVLYEEAYLPLAKSLAQKK